MAVVVAGTGEWDSEIFLRLAGLMAEIGVDLAFESDECRADPGVLRTQLSIDSESGILFLVDPEQTFLEVAGERAKFALFFHDATPVRGIEGVKASPLFARIQDIMEMPLSVAEK